MLMGVAAGEGAGAGGGVPAAGLLRGVQLVLLVARSQAWKCCWLPKLLPAQQWDTSETVVVIETQGCIAQHLAVLLAYITCESCGID
jgi:hypothetical protein